MGGSQSASKQQISGSHQYGSPHKQISIDNRVRQPQMRVAILPLPCQLQWPLDCPAILAWRASTQVPQAIPIPDGFRELRKVVLAYTREGSVTYNLVAGNVKNLEAPWQHVS
jgi:hypothetical protein